MLFWLKKTIASWLMPLPLCLVIAAAGFFLLRYTRRARLGRTLIIAAVAILLVVSNRFVAHSLLRPLETLYPAMPEFAAGAPLPPDLAKCRFVVVLGGGNHRTPEVAASNLLSTTALSRVVEGIRLMRVLPEARMIVTGPGAPEEPHGPTHAAMLARSAVALGIPAQRILFIELARDTEDESRAVKELAKDAPVALVTSAWHMRRAAALFRGAGLATVPCPADFATRDNPGWQWEDYLWDLGAINASSLALRERLGYLWVWLRGKT